MRAQFLRRARSSQSLGIESLERRFALSAAPAVMAVELGSSSWSEAFYDYLGDEGYGQFAYRIPAGSSQEQALPWTNLDRVYMSFSEDVNVDRADLAITGTNGKQYKTIDFFYDPRLLTARWTLAEPLGDADRVLLDLDANGINPVTDLDGNVLDGEWGNSTSGFSSGDGVAGGDFEFLITTLSGDVNGDDISSYFDFFDVYYSAGESANDPGFNPKYDADGSGVIDSADYYQILAKLGATVPLSAPLGLNDDAPTALGKSAFAIDDSAIDESFALSTFFDDNEDEIDDLSFEIASNSAPSLFDSVTIDEATGELIVNTAAGASGRALIELEATDSSGQSVIQSFVLDVDYANLAPQISHYLAVQEQGNVWAIKALITDPDEDTTGWIVEFYGVETARGTVYEDGWVEIRVELPPGASGYEWLFVHDSQNTYVWDWAWIGMT